MPSGFINLYEFIIIFILIPNPHIINKASMNMGIKVPFRG